MSEPTMDLSLTRTQVAALLVDMHREKFPTLDCDDSTVRLYNDLKSWYLEHPVEKATSYWAQIKDRHEGAAWRTVRTANSAHEASWGALTDDMQHRGLRYGELAGHIDDMANSEVLTAEDGTQYRILKPGQEITQ
jgi:hypothetical protein